MVSGCVQGAQYSLLYCSLTEVSCMSQPGIKPVLPFPAADTLTTELHVSWPAKVAWPDHDWLIDLQFYGSSTLLSSFQARSVNLSTLFLGRLPKRLTTMCRTFDSNWQLPYLNQPHSAVRKEWPLYTRILLSHVTPITEIAFIESVTWESEMLLLCKQ